MSNTAQGKISAINGTRKGIQLGDGSTWFILKSASMIKGIEIGTEVRVDYAKMGNATFVRGIEVMEEMDMAEVEDLTAQEEKEDAPEESPEVPTDEKEQEEPVQAHAEKEQKAPKKARVLPPKQLEVEELADASPRNVLRNLPIDTQLRVMARHDAVMFLKMALDSKALPIPAKKAVGYEALMALMDQVTDKFYEDLRDHG